MKLALNINMKGITSILFEMRLFTCRRICLLLLLFSSIFLLHTLVFELPKNSIYDIVDYGVVNRRNRTTLPLHLPSLPVNVPVDKQKVIYFGSPFFGQQFNFHELPDACRVSSDPTERFTADAVVFHLLDLTDNPHLDKPSANESFNKDQVTVGVMYESANSYRHLPGGFNWTMTFRRDSDIFSPYCGRFERAPVGKAIADLEPRIERMRTGGGRKKQVAWMVSNCVAYNHRLDYAIELSNYISVDIYGRCSPNGLRCDRFASNSSTYCWEMLAENYKFYLSFESSHCRDYITEKFYMPAYFGMLPVVYGGAGVEDYQDIAPPHSYIDTRNFASPKELGEFLTKIDASPSLYDEYFSWRKEYTLQHNRSFVGQDVLCAKLWHLEENRKSSHENGFQMWWERGGCVSPPYRPMRHLVAKSWLSLSLIVILVLLSIFSLACFFSRRPSRHRYSAVNRQKHLAVSFDITH